MGNIEKTYAELYPIMHNCVALRLENVHLCLVSWNLSYETKATGAEDRSHDLTATEGLQYGNPIK